jgi:hypothetical protein
MLQLFAVFSKDFSFVWLGTGGDENFVGLAASFA